MVYQRVAIVDEAIRKSGWSLALCNELAMTMNVDRSTVYRLKNMAEKWTRKHLRPTNLEHWRLEHVRLADAAARQAIADKDYSGAAALLKVAGAMTGTIQPAGKVDVHLNNSTTYNAAVAMVSNLSIEEQAAQVDDLIASRGRLKQAIEAECAPVADEPTPLDKG
jgi:hypothetical protein